ncbi:unnamed protein product [Musa textilis]
MFRRLDWVWIRIVSQIFGSSSRFWTNFAFHLHRFPSFFFDWSIGDHSPVPRWPFIGDHSSVAIHAEQEKVTDFCICVSSKVSPGFIRHVLQKEEKLHFVWIGALNDVLF